MTATAAEALVLPFAAVGLADQALVGGKTASLGELIRALGPRGVAVPDGFAITAAAYRRLLAAAGLEGPLRDLLGTLDVDDLGALQRAGAAARQLVTAAPLPPDLERAILEAAKALGPGSLAVRSSATAEDLPEASFAGQQETVLAVSGARALLRACSRCYASLFSDRAIVYRRRLGLDDLGVALAIGVQRLVRADRGCAGVLFTLDTESGCRDVVLINGAWGFGETVVQGEVIPDEWLVFKPRLRQGRPAILSRRTGEKAVELVLSDDDGHLQRRPVPAERRRRLVLGDDQVQTLARWGCAIEDHYSALHGRPMPMDIEWAWDGSEGGLFVLQARPETVEGRRPPGVLRRWCLEPHGAVPLVSGRAIGAGIGRGPVGVLRGPDQLERFRPGDVLVTARTDSDWEPILQRAAAVVTDQGGRTCHAAIVARELGLPAIVGCGDASRRLQDGAIVTAACCEGADGHVYAGALPFRLEEQPLGDLPPLRTRLLLNISRPREAFRLAALPSDGVGLARLEFVIAHDIGIHPLALLLPDQLSPEERAAVEQRLQGACDPVAFYSERLREAMARLAAAFHPRPVLLRFSDFKSNEYARLLGGRRFEPSEPNPMLGWRGASRYTGEPFLRAFGLECRAVAQVRGELGLTNLTPMVPFCRTPQEADRVLAAMAEEGLRRGDDGLTVHMMCELPANVLELEAYAERFDGFSIGSNDLTQLTLGIDRDAERLAPLFSENQPAVRALIRMAIATAHRCGRPISLCGQAPSDDPAFARFLVEEGIDAISLDPDALMATRLALAAIERC